MLSLGYKSSTSSVIIRKKRSSIATIQYGYNNYDSKPNNEDE
jgi:hypothetical protein